MSIRKLPFMPAYRPGDRSFLDLIHSYFAASDILLERLFTRHVAYRSGDSEMLFDPIVFLNRHAIECALKYFLFSQIIKDPVESHDLSELYEHLSPHLTAMRPEELDPLRNIIEFYSAHDTKTGEAFRYPHGKGSRPFQAEVSGLVRLELRKFYRDIQAAKESLLKIAYFLGGDAVADNFVFHDEFVAAEIIEDFYRKNPEERPA